MEEEMKRYLIICALLLGAISASANIGDSYGRTCEIMGGIGFPAEEGWFMWTAGIASARAKFDGDGHCTAIVYTSMFPIAREKIDENIRNNFGWLHIWKDWQDGPTHWWQNENSDTVTYRQENQNYVLTINQHH
jgi:hypothetical protein